MKKKYKILLIVLAVLACSAAGAFYLLMPVPVETQTAAIGLLSQQVNERGELTPEQYTKLSANITGTVGSLPSGVGKQVKKGDPLLVIDSTATCKELENQIESLKLQQSAVYSNNSSGLAEISLRREQLTQ